MMRTSVTLPNMPKYSFNLSADVCQLRPPTNSLPGADSVLFGVDRPDEPEFDAVVPFAVVTPLIGMLLTGSFLITASALCKSWEIRVPFTFSMDVLDGAKGGENANESPLAKSSTEIKWNNG